MAARLKQKNIVKQNNDRLNRLIKSWALQNLQAFVFSLGQYCRQPVSSFLTSSVIGIALALPTGFYLGLENARLVSSGWDNTVQITAFLKEDVDDSNAMALTERLTTWDEITNVQFISRESALEEYRQSSGYAEAIDALDENPLPSLLLIQPLMGSLSEDRDTQLIVNLEELPEVARAQYDQMWVKRLNTIILIIQRGVMILAVFLALAVLLIIGNTIRMAIYNRRSEIEVIKLFGATDRFVRRPFMYTGFWYGLSGGIIAWCLISVSLLMLQHPVTQLAQLYSSSFQLLSLSPKNVFALLGVGIFLGLAGSWISVQRHLNAIEPP
jgi:cell division transport system permease protein